MKQYLRVQQIAESLGVSKSTIWRWVSEGRLPEPFKLAGRTTVWCAEDVQSTVDKIAESQS